MDLQKLKGLLEDQHTWPCDYTFKFIVAKPALARTLALFPEATPLIRPSAKGKYVSVTFTIVMQSSAAVIAIYEEASKIDSIISL